MTVFNMSNVVNLIRNPDVKFYFSPEDKPLTFTKKMIYLFYDACFIRGFEIIAKDIEQHGYKQSDGLFSRTHHIHPERSKVKPIFEQHVHEREITDIPLFIQKMVTVIQSENIPLEIVRLGLYASIANKNYIKAKAYTSILDKCTEENGIDINTKFEMMIASLIAKDYPYFEQLSKIDPIEREIWIEEHLFSLDRLSLKEYRADIDKLLTQICDRPNLVKMLYSVIILNLIEEKTCAGESRQQLIDIYTQNTKAQYSELSNFIEHNERVINLAILMSGKAAFDYLIAQGIDLHLVTRMTIKELAKKPNEVEKLTTLLEAISKFSVKIHFGSSDVDKYATYYSSSCSPVISRFKFDEQYQYGRLYDYAAKVAAKYGNLKFFEKHLSRVSDYREFSSLEDCKYGSKNMKKYCFNSAIEYGHADLVCFFKEKGIECSENYFPKGRLEFLFGKAKQTMTADKGNSVAEVDTQMKKMTFQL